MGWMEDHSRNHSRAREGERWLTNIHKAKKAQELERLGALYETLRVSKQAFDASGYPLDTHIAVFVSEEEYLKHNS